MTQYATYGAVTPDDFEKLIIDEYMEDPTISQINEYCLENGYETFMSADELEDELKTLDPVRAFHLGQFSKISVWDEYYYYDGYANIRSCTETYILETYAADTKKWLLENGNIDSYTENLIDLSDEIIEKCNELIRMGY